MAKKYFKKIVTLSLVLLSFAMHGQTVTIPVANTNSGNVRQPLGTYYGYERSAMIYTPAEIGATGNINQIGFYLNGVNTPGAATNVRVYMKMRPTTMAATTYATETTGATLVYGPTTIPVASFVAGGWVNLPLTTNFNYTGGTDNLEIIIETNATANGNEGISGKQFRYNTQASNQYFQVWLQDGSPPTGTGTLLTARPNIQLNFLSACTTPTAQPTALVLTPGATSIAGSFTAASPAPSNYLVVYNTTGTTPTPVNGTTYTVGGAITGGTVADLDNNTNFNITGLTLGLTYYVYVFSYNSLCIGAPFHLISSPLNGSTTTALTYCTPVHSSSCVTTSISNVTFNTINNTSTCGNVTNTSYNNYAAAGIPTTTVTAGTSNNLSVTSTSSAIVSAWIDFNQNGIYETSEWTQVYTTGTNGSVNILIPITAASGNTTLRIRSRASGNINGSGNPCTSFSSGETEDYKITINPAQPCTTPTTQPTALSLSATGTFISGSFTDATPIPNNYLIVYSTSATPPSPTNGTNYVVGGTVGAGYLVVSNNNNTSFTITGLLNTTTYYIYIYSFNSLCSGGPLYLTTTPLNGLITTNTLNYCTPSVSGGQQTANYFTNVSFVGTLNDVSNPSTFSNNPIGFQDFTSRPKAIQAQGEGVNISVQATYSGSIKAWVDWDKNGVFADPAERVYFSGTTLTSSTTFGFIIPLAQPIGDYRIRIRINDLNGVSTFDPCVNINNPGETEDHAFTVVASCSALITSVTDGSRCGAGAVTVSVTGNGLTYNWYTTPTGGSPIAGQTTNVYSPTLATTTVYYVTAVNGCQSLTRTPVEAKIKPVSNLTFTPTSPEVCGNSVVVAVTASGDVEEFEFIDETFQSGTLGLFQNAFNVSNIASVNTQSAWQIRQSTFIPAQQVWFPAIANKSNANNYFVMSTSDLGQSAPSTPYIIDNSLLSPVFNPSSSGVTNLTLTFKIYYSRYYQDGTNLTKDFVNLDISTNGGTTWTTNVVNYTGDIAFGTNFNTLTFNLNSFIGSNNLRFRIRYYGEWCDGVAIDDIRLFGNRPLSPSFTWSNPIPVVPLTGFAFTDLACTTPYTPGATIGTVYIKPLAAQLVGTSFSFDANVLLSNGCPVTQTITVQNKTKTWNGTTTNWNTPTNWQPNGVPDITNCIIIPTGGTQPILNSGADGLGRNLLVKTGSTFEVSNNLALTIKEAVMQETGSTFNIKDNSSLVQIDNVPNTIAGTGIFNYERIAPNIRGLDYVYWSSPVLGQAVNTIYSTPTPGPKYFWDTVGINSNGGKGNWLGAGGNMNVAQGYIIRGSVNYGLAATNITGNFIGVPNNGNITVKAKLGDMTTSTVPSTYSNPAFSIQDDNWTLTGNPYPSAINGLLFLQANTANIEAIELWRHTSAPTTIASPFYQNFIYNYNSNDYLRINFTGPTVPSATDIVKAGQGFMALRREGAQDLVGIDVNFTNSMRLNGATAGYNNSGFFRSANTTNSILTAEKHRYWLDLVNTTNNVSETALIGYVEGASNGNDLNYDSEITPNGNMQIYTLLPEKNCLIQGKALPFENSDKVQLGITAITSGNYTLALKAVDGLFENQDIFIEDLLTNITHNLKANPYSFTTEAGTFNNRFVLKYNNVVLNNQSFTELTQGVKAFGNNKTETFYINSEKMPIKSITIFDLLGKRLFSKNNINTNNFETKEFKPTNTINLVRIELENGLIINQKIIF